MITFLKTMSWLCHFLNSVYNQKKNVNKTIYSLSTNTVVGYLFYCYQKGCLNSKQIKRIPGNKILF